MPTKNSVCTINTDAGWYRREKIGSYAFWIKADGLFLKGSGVFKSQVKSPWHGEMMAIINALHILEQSGYSRIFRLIINRDNIHAKAKKKGNELEREMALRLSRLRKKCGYKGLKPFHEFRHVKAHNGTEDKRSFVNDWCDQQCKARLKEYANANFQNPNTKSGSGEVRVHKRDKAGIRQHIPGGSADLVPSGNNNGNFEVDIPQQERYYQSVR